MLKIRFNTIYRACHTILKKKKYTKKLNTSEYSTISDEIPIIVHVLELNLSASSCFCASTLLNLKYFSPTVSRRRIKKKYHLSQTPEKSKNYFHFISLIFFI